MVDLHQVEPGLPDGHPWLTFSRWQMAWRTFLGVAVIGIFGTGVFALTASPESSRSVLTGSLPVIFGGLIPTIAAGLEAMLGVWLRRYYPFTQSLLFGAFAVGAVLALSAILSIVEGIVRGPCPPDVYCSAPLDGLFWAFFLFGWPTFLISAIGLGFAIWSPSPRGRKFFLPAVITALLVFVAWLVVAYW